MAEKEKKTILAGPVPVDTIDRALELLFKSQVVPLVLGPAGIGKTAGFARCADNLGVAFDDITLSDLDLPDLRLPYVQKGVMQFAFDQRWPLERYKSLHAERGILLIDEITGCDQIMQRPIWRLALERKLGGEKLLPGWVIGLAGNGLSDRAGAQAFSFPLANRLSIIEVGPPTHDGWRKWAISKGLDPRVIGWISHAPDTLYKADMEKFDAGAWAQPTPRSWEKVSVTISHTSNLQAPGVALAVNGLVGAEVGTRAMAWMRVGDDLPDIGAILAGLETRLPTTPGGFMVLVAGLAARVQPSSMRALGKYGKALPKEFKKLLSTDLTSRGGEIITAPGFGDLL